MKKMVWAALMTVLLLLYVAWAGQIAVSMISTGMPVFVILGVALLIIPVLVAVAAFLEWRMALQVDALAKEANVQVTPGVNTAAKAVEADPSNWEKQFELGLAYMENKQRKQARAAFRRAVELKKDAGAR